MLRIKVLSDTTVSIYIARETIREAMLYSTCHKHPKATSNSHYWDSYIRVVKATRAMAHFRNLSNVGALIIRIGFGGYNDYKAP